MNHFTKLMGSISVIALFAATPVMAEELDFAGTLTGQYSHVDPTLAGVDNINLWGIGGSGVFGLDADGVNLQVDVGYNRLDSFFDADIYNFGGALFYAGDETRGGIKVHYTNAAAPGMRAELFNFEGFGEFYLDDAFTIGASGGGFSGDSSGWNLAAFATGYIDPDFAVTGGVSYVDINKSTELLNFSIRAEYLVSQDMPVSIFGGYTYTDLSGPFGAAHTLMVGVKFYFGNTGSSLVERHRGGTIENSSLDNISRLL